MTVARYFTGISAVSISNRLKSRRCAYSFSRSLAIARCEDEMEKSFFEDNFCSMQRGRPRIWKLCYFGLLKAFKKNEGAEKHIFQERVTK